MSEAYTFTIINFWQHLLFFFVHRSLRSAEFKRLQDIIHKFIRHFHMFHKAHVSQQAVKFVQDFWFVLLTFSQPLATAMLFWGSPNSHVATELFWVGDVHPGRASNPGNESNPRSFLRNSSWGANHGHEAQTVFWELLLELLLLLLLLLILLLLLLLLLLVLLLLLLLMNMMWIMRDHFELYIHMILVVSLIMKLDFGPFTTSGIGWDNVFFLNVPLVYFGMAHMTKKNCKELRPWTGFLILLWIGFLLSNAVSGAFVHAGRVAVGCCAWAKIGSWNTRFQSCLK